MKTQKLLELWQISKQKTLLFERLNPKSALPLLLADAHRQPSAL
jgi:hypothetical protein